MPLKPNWGWCMIQPYQAAFVDSRDLKNDRIERVILPPNESEKAPLMMLELIRAG